MKNIKDLIKTKLKIIIQRIRGEIPLQKLL